MRHWLARVQSSSPVYAAAVLGFWLVLVGLVGFTALRYLDKAEKPSRLGTQTRTAILRWKDQVQRLVRGENVYPPGNPYPNPPIMALILSPLYELSPNRTAQVWFLVKLGLAALALAWTLRFLRPLPQWAVLLTIGLSLHPILGDLSHGNVNILIAFLVVGMLAAYHRGWDWLAGIVLALGIACKVTPLLFVPYFGWKWLMLLAHRWRLGCSWLVAVLNPGLNVLAGTLLGLWLWLVLVPGACLGWSTNLTLLESWYTSMVKPFVVDGKITAEHANQSLPGLFTRLFTNQPSDVDYDEEDRPVPTQFHTLIDLGPEVVRNIVRVMQLLFFTGLVWLCRNPTAQEPPQRRGLYFTAEVGYVILGMLLLSERTWKHHGVVLMVPYAALIGWVVLQPQRWRIVGIVLLMIVSLTLVPSLASGELQDQAIAYGSTTASYVLLTGVMLWILRGQPRSAVTDQELTGRTPSP